MTFASRHRHWWLQILAATLMATGVFFLAGGIYLVTLGGSWYYVVAGVGLVLSGWRLWRGMLDGVYLFMAVFLFTVLWTYYETGLNFWGWVPRMAAPLVLATVILLSVPLLPDPGRTSGLTRLARTGGLASGAVFAAFFTAMLFPHGAIYNDIAITPGKQTETTLAMGKEWREYGRTGEGIRYSPLDQINKENLQDLEVIWTAHHGQVSNVKLLNEDQNTPIYADGKVFHCAYNNVVTAFDGATGELQWQFNPDAAAPYWLRCRSISYVDPAKIPARPKLPSEQAANSAGGAPNASPEIADANAATTDPAEKNPNQTADTSKDCGPRIAVATVDGRLMSIKASDGKLCQSFGDSGVVDLHVGMGAYPDGQYMPTTGAILAGDKIIIGGWVTDNQAVDEAPGVVRAFDALTGDLAWAWDSGNPAISKLPPEGETYTRGSPNVWPAMSYDLDLNMVYLPTGNATPDYWGGNRTRLDDEYSSAIVAVDLDTGKAVWHFQTTHHDLWDYDLPAQPALVDFPKGDGTTVPAVVQLTKRGQIFVLDRRTGEPLTKVEERPVPKGSAQGERYSPTQPFAVGMPQIGTDPGLFSENRAWGMTPFDHLYCRIRTLKTRWDGLMTPPSTDVFFEYPGNGGGFNWGSASFDQSRNLLVLNDMRWPTRSQLVPRGEIAGQKTSAGTEAGPMRGTPYEILVGYDTLQYLQTPCFEPPYGTVTAIDLATQKIKWQIPMGTMSETGPFGLKTRVPIYTGMPTLGGLLTTRPGISFFAGTQDYYLRAIDTETGKILWKDSLPVGSQSVPITYIDKTGRQVIVVQAGGARHSPDRGDYLIAYAVKRTGN